MFVQGEVCTKKVWCITDYTDNVLWVYHIDGSTMFVCQIEEKEEMSDHHKAHPDYASMGVFAGYGEHDFYCDHIAKVSISEDECQCMDCLTVWTKDKSFRSDWPQYDRG